jgi:hypothetical protein
MADYSGSTGGILSNYDEVLKTYYLPAIQDQLNGDNILSDIIDTNEKDVSGKNATIECHYGRSTGLGARADGGSMPTAAYQKYKTMTVPMRYNYGRVVFSGPTIAATRDDKGSYARVVDNEISGIVSDMQKEINRQLWGCGYGILARWASGTGTTVTLNKAYRGNAVGGDGFGSTFGQKYLEEMASGTWNIATSSTGITTMTVSTTDIAPTSFTAGTVTDSLTVTNVDTPAAGTYVVRLGSSRTMTSSTAAGYARLEMMGLRGVVADTDLDDIAIFNGTYTGYEASTANDPFQGLDVSTYPWWKANVDTHASGRYGGQRALNLTLMQKMFDKVEAKAGKGYGPDLILTTPAIRREYIELMQAHKMIVNDMKIEGGWSGISYNGVMFYVDNVDAIDGEMYFLTTKDLQIYRMSDYDWMNKDGSVLSRCTGYDAYEAILFRYAELGCNRRNSQGVIADLSYDN